VIFYIDVALKRGNRIHGAKLKCVPTIRQGAQWKLTSHGRLVCGGNEP